jgi:hypothetical protein
MFNSYQIGLLSLLQTETICDCCISTGCVASILLYFAARPSMELIPRADISLSFGGMWQTGFVA